MKNNGDTYTDEAGFTAKPYPKLNPETYCPKDCKTVDMSKFTMYKPGSDIATKLGFTKDKFDGWIGYNDSQRRPVVIISFIMSKEPGKGNVSRFIHGLLDRNFEVQIPTPMDKMIIFVRKHGFRERIIKDRLMGPVEVWIKRGRS